MTTRSQLNDNSSTPSKQVSMESWERWISERKDSEEKRDGIEYFMRVHNIWNAEILREIKNQVREEEEEQEYKMLARIRVSRTNHAQKPKRKDRSRITNGKLIRKLAHVIRESLQRAETPKDGEGYVKLEWVLEKPQFHGITRERVMETIKKNGKDRFEWKDCLGKMD